MIALAVLVARGVVPLAMIAPAGEFLVRHLALLYIPAGVALVAYAAVVRQDVLAITLAALASLVAVLLVVGVTLERFGRDA